MFTHKGAGRREGVVLADQADCVCVAAGGHQSHVAWNVHACRTERHTGNRLIQMVVAAGCFNVAYKVLTEAGQSFKNHIGGLVADGTVSGG
ncbi:hypothetical protein CLOM621_07472 [Clostridium sp. M62/1]|nr:hypothetical protein CLOM621_07472 [Clostridium sp. M62/1]